VTVDEVDEVDEAVEGFLAHPHAVRLDCPVQPYAWGGREFLADLLGLPAVADEPRAELWIGAHPSAPSRAVIDGARVALDALVARAPQALLGPAASRFGALPYLLKVLDVRAMLSIQAHPTRAQAEDGVARENAAGVPIGAAHRNYRDASHKPEAQVALTEFWLLHGFRPIDQMRAVLGARRELAEISRWLAGSESGGLPARARLERLYTRVMTMPQRDVDGLLDPLLERLMPQYEAGRIDPASPDFWAARAAGAFVRPGGHRDRGILSIYLLNLVRLAPGEGTFIGAGVLHAYLSGVAVEVMASSDNVLRGGLTPKHVDVPELLRILRFDPCVPVVTRGEVRSPGERVFEGPAEEFELRRLVLPPGATHVARAAAGPDTLVVLEGEVVVHGVGDTVPAPRGTAVFVPAGLHYELTTGAGALVFVAAVRSVSEICDT
jgi:mannose-6-phosphate isomerase